jgi:hypothetical protein
VRREALRFLKRNAVRDGVWNERIMAVTSEFLMSIGEEGTGPARWWELVPEGVEGEFHRTSS